MALSTKRNQIVGMIVCLVPVDVMHMQLVLPSLALFPAKLTRPFIPVLDLLAQTLPVGGVFPFGDAPLPRRIVDTRRCASQNKGLACCPPSNAKFIHHLDDGAHINAKLVGNFGNCALFVAVLQAQPVWVVIQHFGAIVARCISLPFTVLAHPAHWLTATASAQRRRARRLVSGLARTMVTRLRLCARSVPVLLEHVADMPGRAPQSRANFSI